MSITEDELKERAVAPRVTLDQVNEAIVSEIYFTGAEGGLGAAFMDPSNDVRIPESTRCLTFCVLTLKNGFTVTGQSACADPANYKRDIGERIAREDAVNKIWPLLGYELRSRLALIATGTPPSDPEMRTYVGTKVIHAKPMTREDYNRFRGWQVPANENPLDEGYLVEYTDGGKPIVDGYVGYVSWSPKEVFEKAYKVSTGA